MKYIPDFEFTPFDDGKSNKFVEWIQAHTNLFLNYSAIKESVDWFVENYDTLRK